VRFQKENNRTTSYIDITPIIDTVFNLLIFFALSLNFISTPGIKVQLPKSSAKEVALEPKDVRVVISEAGQLYLNEDAVTPQVLGEMLQKAAAKSPETRVLIQADERVPHGRVVEVMDFARIAGLTRLAIVTQPPNTQRR